MANLHISLESTCKSTISKIFTRCQNWGVHSTTCDPELRYESCALTSFMGFPAILSALQPFQICISNRKNSKLTFSKWLSLMQKGLWQNCMFHWRVHAKKEFPRFPPDVRTGGPLHNLWSWTQIWKLCIDIFYGVSCNIKCITAISNLHFQ